MNRQEFIKTGFLLTAGSTNLTNDLTTLLVAANTKPLYIPPAKGEVFQLPKLRITIKVSGADTDGNYSIFEELTEPGGGTPLHTHEHQWEIIEVHEGLYKVKANDTTHLAERGGIVVIPPNTPHAYLNITKTISKFRFTLWPSLNFEDFIKKMASFKEMPAKKELAKTLKTYGMNLLGPPLEAD